MRETPPPASGSSYPEMVLEQVSRMAREHLLVPSHNHAIHRFGDHLAEIRVVRGLSLVELERRAGITLLRLFLAELCISPQHYEFFTRAEFDRIVEALDTTALNDPELGSFFRS